MSTLEREHAQTRSRSESGVEEVLHEKWAHVHVNWTAVFVGALAAFSMILLFGLAEIAVGGHAFGPEHRVVDLKKLGIGTLIASVCGAFFSFVLGGWVAGKLAGILHSEPGMLHGAIVWVVTVPILIVVASLGAASFFGGWFTGLGSGANAVTASSMPYVRPDLPSVGASAADITTYREQQAEYNRNVAKWNEETPKVARNSALSAITALLLGLMGAVVGGWMASGEPMNFTHYRTRRPHYHLG